MTTAIDGESPLALNKQIWAIQVLSMSSVASLALWAYDWLLTLADERKFIWGTWRLNKRIKLLFLFIRYYCFIIQITIHIWSTYLGSSFPVPVSECTGFIVVGIVGPLVQSNSLDFLLLLRVWILFKRTRTSLVLLTGILTSQIFIVAILIMLYIPYMNIDEYCIAHLSMTFFILSGTFSILFQTIAWAFTIHQCRKASNIGWRQHALVELLEKDGTVTWLGISTLLLIAIITVVIDRHFTAFFNCWLTTLTSIAGCRMIINLQHLADNGDIHVPCTELSIDVELTTHVVPAPDLGTMWSDVDDHMMDTYARIQDQLELSTLDHR